MAKKISRRLNDMRAAICLEDLRNMPGHYHELKQDRKGQLAVHLVQPYRLIFIPVGNPEEFMQDGSLVWKKVQAVEVIEITDYHD